MRFIKICLSILFAMNDLKGLERLDEDLREAARAGVMGSVPGLAIEPSNKSKCTR